MKELTVHCHHRIWASWAECPGPLCDSQIYRDSTCDHHILACRPLRWTRQESECHSTTCQYSTQSMGGSIRHIRSDKKIIANRGQNQCQANLRHWIVKFRKFNPFILLVVIPTDVDHGLYNLVPEKTFMGAIEINFLRGCERNINWDGKCYAHGTKNQNRESTPNSASHWSRWCVGCCHPWIHTWVVPRDR